MILPDVPSVVLKANQGSGVHPITEGDRFGASGPSRADSASWKSPVDKPRR